MAFKEKYPNVWEKPAFYFEEDGNIYRFLSEEDEADMDKVLDDTLAFINDEKNSAFGKTKKERDEIYTKMAKLVEDMVTKVGKQIGYKFYLTRREHQYLVELLRTDLEYPFIQGEKNSYHTVFIGADLEKSLSKWNSMQKEGNYAVYSVTGEDAILVYTLLKTHKPKGLGEKTKMFMRTFSIFEVSYEIIQYYNRLLSIIRDEVYNWVRLGGPDPEDVPQQTLIETKTEQNQEETPSDTQQDTSSDKKPKKSKKENPQ